MIMHAHDSTMIDTRSRMLTRTTKEGNTLGKQLGVLLLESGTRLEKNSLTTTLLRSTARGRIINEK